MSVIDLNPESAKKLTQLAAQRNQSVEDYLNHTLPLQTVLEQLPDTIYVFNFVKRQVEFINHDSFLGYSIAVLTGSQSLFPYVHADDKAALTTFWTSLDKPATNPSEIFRMYDMDGNWHWIQIRYVVLSRQADNTPEQVLFHLSDITPYKEAEATAQRNEQRYQSVLDTMEEGVIFRAVNDQVTLSNTSAARILEMSVDDIQQSQNSPIKNTWKIIHEDGATFAPEDYPPTLALRTGTAQLGVVMGFRKPDDDILWVSINACPVFDQDQTRVVGVVSTFSDITLQKQHEDQLLKLTQAIEQSPLSVVMTDLNWRFTYVNPKFTDLTGYTLDEVLGENPQLIRSGKTEQSVYAQLEQTIANDRAWQGEFVNRKKNGEHYWESAVIAPMHNHLGEHIGYIAVKEDITERKNLQEALRKSEEELRFIFELTDVGIALADSKGNLLQVNPAFCLMLEYTLEEMIGKNFSEFTASASLEAELVLMEGVVAGEAEYYALEKQYIAKSGRVFWVHLTVSAHRDFETGDIIHFIGVVKDIDERKQMEQDLRESEARYRALFERTNDAVFIFGLDGVHLDVNQQAANMLGYSREEIINSSAEKYLKPDQLQQADQRLKRLLAGETLPVYERQFVHKDGSTIFGEINIALVQDEDGNPQHFHSVVRNITQRKLAEQELHKSQATLQSFFNSSPLLMGIVELLDDDMLHLADNPTAAQFFGTTTDAMRNQRASALGAPPEAIEMWLTHYRQAAAQQKPVRFEYQHTIPSHTFWLAATVNPIEVQGKQRFSYIVEDVTEYRHAVEQLRQTKDQLDTILHNISDGIAVIDHTDRIIYVNEVALQMAGYHSAEEVIQQRGAHLLVNFDIFDEHGEPVTLRQLPGQKARYGQESPPVTLNMRHKEGRDYWWRITAKPIYDDQQQIELIIIVAQDITEQRLAEQHRFDLALEQERRSIISGFVRDAAHEFRTPLAVIGTSTYLLEATHDATKRQHYREKVTLQVSKITDLLDSMLTIIHLNQLTTLPSQELDLTQVIHQFTISLQTEIAKKHHTLHTNLPPDPMTILGNLDHITLLLKHLLDNAMKFTPNGGEILMAAKLDKDQVIIKIQDSGDGISPEALPHIFDLYYRENQARTDRGFGLGLGICKRILELHGGNITVESRLEEGTLVTVTLPTLMRNQ